MKKIFISQHAKGKNNSEILAERERAIKIVQNRLKDDITIVNLRLRTGEDDNNLFALGKSLEKLANADVAVFIGDFNEARICKMEFNCAVEYGIDIIFV